MSNKSSLHRIGRLLRHVLLGFSAFAAAVVVLTIGLLSTDIVTAPAWVQEAADSRIKEVIGDSAVSTGTMTLAFDPFSFDLVLHVHDVAIKSQGDAPSADLRDIRVKADAIKLLQGIVEIEEVAAGEIDLWFHSERIADEADAESGSESPATAHASVPRGLLGSPALILEGLSRGIGKKLSKVSIASLDVRFQVDGRSDWSVRNGLLMIARSQSGISGEAQLEVGRDGGEMLPLSFSVSSVSSSTGTAVRVDAKEMEILDFASHLLGMEVLRAVDLPATGSLEADFDSQGEMTQANAAIRVGAASVHLQEEGGLEPLEVRFVSAQIRFDPESDRFAITSLALDSDAALINAEGHAYLDTSGSASPVVKGSLRFDDAVIDPVGVFEAPLQNLAGVLDFRLSMSPLNLEIMRLSLKKADATLTATGKISSTKDGWRARSDFHANRIPRSELFALWPLPLVGNTREWMSENFVEGEIFDVNGALRVEPGSRPDLLVTYKFRGMLLNYLGAFPAVEGGTGYGVITLDDALVNLDAGGIALQGSELIDVSGSNLIIPDSNDPNVPARIGLEVNGPIEPILSVLNLPPLMLLDKGGIRSDFASGAASGSAALRFPLLKNVALDDVEVEVSGALTSVVAADLFGGKAFRSERLDVSADSAALSVSGNGLLGDLPVSGMWSKRYSGDGGDESALAGNVELSKKFLDEFGILLPGDPISGIGTASFELTSETNLEPAFKIASDLRGLSSDVPALNWRKLKEEDGHLVVEGTLSDPMVLNKIELSSSGLSAAGTARMREGGGLERADFESFRVDDWLDVSVELEGAESLAITGGFLDSSLVETADAVADADDEGRPVDVVLDLVKISDSIELSDFIGEFKFGGGVEGRFTAAINGRAKINGTIAPHKNGSVIKIRSDDAGSALRASGIIQNLYDGSFRMTLLPTDGEGTYRGRIIVDNSRVKDMPALGELLNYVSIVGIIDQLVGEGIHFSEVTADFEIGKDGVVLQEGIAIGSSIGITMAGRYDLASARMNMEGMVTPFYALNQLVGAITPLPNLFGIQKGEGFGGIYFTMRGPAADPEVQIDPSSVLTPGVLNRIFRQ